MCLEQNWMFADRGEEAVGGYRNLYFFADVVRKWMTPYQIFLLFAIKYDFFSLPIHSLLFHSFFHGFCMLIKR